MSGDLKDPGKSLPRGTFAAVGLSLVIYFAAAVIFAGSLSASVLVDDYRSMKRIALYGWLIDAGLIAATLSSAMASFLGAPRILQSLAGDRIFPLLHAFAAGEGPSKNPRRAVLLSGAIALAMIFLGNLNFIASVVSMFFLITYALLNYATFYEAKAASPYFRPRFRFFHARLSLLGALGALGSMIAIDPPASGVAVAVLFAIHQYLKRTAGPARWADSRRSYQFQLVRENLLAMAPESDHPRDWRPCILAFCDDPSRREQLLRFASWIEGGSGLTTAVHMIEGEDEKALQLRAKSEEDMRREIAEHGLQVFPRVIVAPDFRVGVETLIQSFGIGSIHANMVLLSRLDQVFDSAPSEDQLRYGRELQEAMRLRCNIVVLDADSEEWSRAQALEGSDLRIDVWWWGDRTSHLMLLLAYLMTRSEHWSGAAVRVLVPTSPLSSEKTLASVRQLLQEIRIDAEAEAVLEVDADAVARCSEAASLVFFPLRFRELGFLRTAGERPNAEAFLKRLPIMALTLAAQDIDLQAGPDEGKMAEIAAALDAAKETEAEAIKAEETALRLAREAREKLQEYDSGDSDSEIGATLAEAQRQANTAAARALEARQKANEAAAAAVDAGVEIPPKK